MIDHDGYGKRVVRRAADGDFQRTARPRMSTMGPASLPELMGRLDRLSQSKLSREHRNKCREPFWI
jgi:hypothetical protein